MMTDISKQRVNSCILPTFSLARALIWVSDFNPHADFHGFHRHLILFEPRSLCQFDRKQVQNILADRQPDGMITEISFSVGNEARSTGMWDGFTG